MSKDKILLQQVLKVATENPELTKKGMELVSQYSGGVSPGQGSESPQAKKPLKKGLSMQTKLMMGVGALMLMLVLGPMILPAMAGMGAMGSALMAGAGAGLLAYGAKKAIEDRESPSTGYSNRIQPLSDQMGNAMGTAQQLLQNLNHGQGQDSSANQLTGQQNRDKALQEVKESGAVDGVKPDQAIIKEVDAKRAELMEKLALPDSLKTMVNSNTMDFPAFSQGFDEHLKQSFFANMGEKDKGKSDAGMGIDFLKKVNASEPSDEKVAFDKFKDNMMALLKKDQEHYQSPQAHAALTAEKSALTTAIEQIQGLRAGNKSIKAGLDRSGSVTVSSDQKVEADKVRLDSLKTANKNISQAKDNFETKKIEAKSTTATSQLATAASPAQGKGQGQG